MNGRWMDGWRTFERKRAVLSTQSIVGVTGDDSPEEASSIIRKLHWTR